MSWEGGSFGVAMSAECVLAPNANMMTLDGTNTWVLRARDFGPSIVVDPGPLDPRHLGAIRDVAGEISQILLTHHHFDHSEGARALADLAGCKIIRALDPEYRLGSEGLGDGDVVEVGGLEIRVVGTPGHTADSLSFLVPAERAVLTGDTVLGRGTTVVAHPDGELGAYLDSLDRLHALAEAHEVTAIWPGHGPVIPDALAALDYYISHRGQRLDQVRAALGVLSAQQPVAEDDLPRQVVEIVYQDVDPVLWGAAELSVRAQLAYLRE
ncbi:MAG: fold metallo-hydrolase [Marmoricola sp.]|nr:fold metallo-hydrolase [Marmoricola sp.]